MLEPSANSPPHLELAQQYRVSEETLRLFIDSVKDYAIFLLDPHGYVMTWNEGAQQIKGYSASEIIGKHFSNFYPQEQRDARHPEEELQIARQTGRYQEEGWRVRKDGTLFWANVVITALYENGELVGFGKVTRDLTERKNAEQRREADQKIIAESIDELQRMAYVVSHELQAPIATILRYSNLLKVRYSDRLGEDANEFIAKTTDAGKLVSRIVDDLWTYARISRPSHSIETVYTDKIVDEAAEELQDCLAAGELTHGRLPAVSGNKAQLGYLFKELIQNAVKYRGEKPPRIQIEAQAESGGWLFSVHDDGIGIDEVFRKDVFKFFHRLNGGIETNSTGMGLAICKKIIQHHGGRIWFESQPNQGTTFYFWIPEQRLSVG